MIVAFVHEGQRCEADVVAVGTPDECPHYMPDVTCRVRWIRDSGACRRELEASAVSAFLEASGDGREEA